MADAGNRRSERMQTSAGAACPFAAPLGEALGPVRVRDASMHGVGLFVLRRVEVGTVLAVTLANPARGLSRTVLVKVTNVTPVPGGFHLGGEFDAPLTYQEWSALVT